MAPDLHLGLCPEEAEVLGVMLRKAGDLRMASGVAFQLLLPHCGLFLGDDASDDNASGLADQIFNLGRQTPSILLDGGKADLRYGLGAEFGDLVHLCLQGLCQMVVRVGNFIPVLRLHDGLLQDGEPLLQQRTSVRSLAMIRYNKVNRYISLTGIARALAPEQNPS